MSFATANEKSKRRKAAGDSTQSKEERRAERKNAARQAFVEAAVDVVGKIGYEKASIALIAKRAGLSLGAFYLHFDSRQDIFDELLPHLGNEMLQYVRDRVHGARDFYEVDKRGLKAFFEFVRMRPGFYRVLSEAEASAPRGYERYNAVMLQRFVVSLERSRAAGDIVGFTGKELVLIAYLLMGARRYIHRGFERSEPFGQGIPDWIVDTYARFVRHGLDGSRASKKKSEGT